MSDFDELDEASSPYSRKVGERLRTIRRQKRLSLQEVEASSDQEFKASVLGAYERGERAISVPRLERLSSTPTTASPPSAEQPRPQIATAIDTTLTSRAPTPPEPPRQRPDDPVSTTTSQHDERTEADHAETITPAATPEFS